MRTVVSSALVVLVWGGSAFGDGASPTIRKNIVYSKPGGTELKLDFFRPDGDGPFPLVVCIHGGAWCWGERSEFHDMTALLTGQGYACATIQYRLAPKHKFPAQLEDVRAALAFLRAGAKDYRIDPARVALLGGSAGGHLALLGGLAKPPAGAAPVRAVVNLAGPADLVNYAIPDAGEQQLRQGAGKGIDGILEDLLGTSDRKAAVWAEASPITHVAAGNPAVLTIQGTKDLLVPDSQARKLHEALKKAGVPEKLFLIEGGGHDVGNWPPGELLASLGTICEFLNTHLKKN